MRRVPIIALLLALEGCGRLGFGFGEATRDDARPSAEDEAGTSGDGATNSGGGDANGGASNAGDSGPDSGSGGSSGTNTNGGMNGSTSSGGTTGGTNMLPDPGPPGPDTSFTSSANLSWDNTNGRTCADGGDMVSYSVIELMSTRAVLSTSPGSGCLNVGDEVLIANLQGTSNANANVGKFEFLTVASVAGSEVLFTSPKTNVYGAAADDSSLGTSRSQQRVILQRVPRYGNVTIASGATLTAYAWDGTRGGVFALRVIGELQIDGIIDMSGKGFSGGPATDPVSTTGQQGESIAGRGAQNTNANFGGGGGGLGDSMGCRQSGSPGGGGGHVANGTAATVSACSGLGAGAAGVMLGNPSLLLLGSGGGAGGTDNVRTDNPPGGQGGEGGGAVFIYATNVSGSGSILARGFDGQGDAPGVECNGGSNVTCWDHAGPGGGGAGGTLWLTTNSVQSSVMIDLSGGLGGNGNNALSGDGGPGASGRIVRMP